MADLHEHWQQVYTTKSARSVSWYQPLLATSLGLIRRAAPDIAASVVDIGGGAATLVDSLLDAGYRDLTVVDISEAALSHARARLGDKAAPVTWIAADITAWSPQRTWDVWHDRAVFHFLTDTAAQDRYIDALRKGTRPGSTAIVATFALDGPERCSGLPVQRYSPATLAARIGAPFALTGQHAERHTTPGGAVQSFMYAVLTRGSAPA